jgi:cytochrome c oxidase subunit III
MSRRPGIEVGHLPVTAFGSRDPLWWGVVLLICIESTVFALLWVTYFFVRGNETGWPPTGLSNHSLRIAFVNLALLLLSIPPMLWVNHGTRTGRLRTMRAGLWLGTLLGAAFLVLRGFEFASLGFRWDSHAYGSVFWVLLGLHTMHAVAGTAENLMLLALLYIGPIEEKHLPDLRINSLYWFFMVGSWVVTFCILFLDPAVWRA